MNINWLKLKLVYDPLEGLFFRTDTHEQVFGHKRGGRKGNEYVGVSIDGVDFYAHRLAWLYMTGEWPKYKIDHKDTVKQHNWWSNLREATTQQNNWNRDHYSNSKSGFKGVSLHKASGLWRACAGRDKKHLNFGYFKTPEEARDAYIAGTAVFQGEFQRSK